MEQQDLPVLHAPVYCAAHRGHTLCAGLTVWGSLQAKRLPVQEHMHMVGTGSGRTAKWAVLNVDTVVQVLAAVRNGESWSTAFQEHVPLRKRRTHDPSATQKNRISDV